jgi:hypothetical protein
MKWHDATTSLLPGAILSDSTSPSLLVVLKRCQTQEVVTMVSQSPGSVSPFMDTVQAAGFLNISPRTLEKQRVIGGGPRFRKFGSRVLYAVVDLQAWADGRSYADTAEAQDVKSGRGR